MKNVFTLSLLFATLIFTSCDKEKNEPFTGFQQGVFILNEGNMSDFNASVSYFHPDSQGIKNDIFYTANGRPLGSVGQDIAVHDNSGYLVVNVSSKMEIVALEDFVSTGTIEVSNPRGFLPLSASQGLITYSSYPGKVMKVNTTTALIEDSVDVGAYPGKMILHNQNVLVANGTFGLDHTLTQLDPVTLDTLQTIPVSDGTVDMVVDKNNAVWVLCQGKVTYDISWNVIGETDSKLVQLDPVDYSIQKEFVLGTTGDSFNPIKMAIDATGEAIYFIEADGIYAHSIESRGLSQSPFIAGSFSAVGISPDGEIFATVTNGYTAVGLFKVFDASGNLTKTEETGVAPNHIFVHLDE